MQATDDEPLFHLLYTHPMSKNLNEDELRLAVGFLDTDKLIDVAPYKAFVALVSLTKDSIQTQRKFQVSARELMAEMGIEHNNYDRLKETIKYLIGTVVEFNVSKQDRHPGWEMAPIIGAAKLENGIVYFEFLEPIWEKLKHPLIYAYITRKGVYSFTSKYDVALYNWFTRMLVPKRSQLICEVEITDLLKNILRVDEKHSKTYSSYMRLNDKILSKSVKKINDKTNLFVTYEGIRNSRKVASVRFCIGLKEKSVAQPQQPLPAELKRLVQLLVKEGLTLDAKIESRLVELVEAEGEKACQKRVKAILTELKTKKNLQNPGGYIRSKLFEDRAIVVDEPETDREPVLVQEYQALLHKTAKAYSSSARQKQFAAYLAEHFETYLPRIQALAESNTILRKLLQNLKSPDKATVLGSRSIVAHLYAERTVFDYPEEEQPVEHILETDLQAVLAQTREELSRDLPLRQKFTGASLKLSEIEALAVETLAVAK